MFACSVMIDKSNKSLAPNSNSKAAKRLSTCLLAAFSACILVPDARSQNEGAPSQSSPAPAPQAPAQQAQDPQTMLAQLEALNQRLATAEQEARTAPEVQKEQAQYEESLTKAVVDENPDLEQPVEVRNALVQKLQGHPDLQKPESEWSAEFQAEVQQYRQLEQAIAPKRAEVARTPELMEKWEKVETVLVEEMSKVDPEVPNLLAYRTDLVQRIQQAQQ